MVLKTVWETVSAPFSFLNSGTETRAWPYGIDVDQTQNARPPRSLTVAFLPFCGTAVATLTGMNAELHRFSARRTTMKEHNHDNFRKYDNPIPKPPDELFDEFLRNTEARLITQRFNVNRQRTIKPVNGNGEAR